MPPPSPPPPPSASAREEQRKKEKKDRGEISYFTGLLLDQQREYLDHKQQNQESILHLVPFFKGALPQAAQQAVPCDESIEEERLRNRLETEGAYLMDCVKVML